MPYITGISIGALLGLVAVVGSRLAIPHALNLAHKYLKIQQP